MQEEIVNSVAGRKGHFLMESGHHGDLWLDLELLCLRPARIRRFAMELAQRLSRYEIDAVCGPLVEGSFVGLMVASELNVDFTYSEPFAQEHAGTLFPVGYRIPSALQSKVRGRRVAIVNDVINAGSSVRGTFSHLQTCGAKTVVIGALLVLGNFAAAFAAERNVILENLALVPNSLWTPSECPLCASGMPLDNERKND